MLPFDLPDSLAINRARLDHLDSLGLPLTHRTVLEPGSGIGNLTEFFERRECVVTSTELFQSNIEENLRRHPGRQRILLRDVASGFSDLGVFNIVFCYGLLYHVRNPEKLIRDMRESCNELLLLETMVHPIDDRGIHLYPQHPGADQGMAGEAYRPSRNWVLGLLAEIFPFAYISATQPNHIDFKLEWPAPTHEVARAIFVASFKPLESPFLLVHPPKQCKIAL